MRLYYEHENMNAPPEIISTHLMLMWANELVIMRTKIDYIAYGIQEIATQQKIQK